MVSSNVAFKTRKRWWYNQISNYITILVVFLTLVYLVAPADMLKCAHLLCSAPSDPSQAGKRPPVAADSEVYKMLQENQDSDEPPRQSASFKVLQEILETGTDPAYHSQLRHRVIRQYSFTMSRFGHWSICLLLLCRKEISKGHLLFVFCITQDVKTHDEVL